MRSYSCPHAEHPLLLAPETGTIRIDTLNCNDVIRVLAETEKTLNSFHFQTDPTKRNVLKSAISIEMDVIRGK
jgi:hypothetical protein